MQKLNFAPLNLNATDAEVRFSTVCNLRQQEANDDGVIVYKHNGFSYLPEISMTDLMEVYSTRGTLPVVMVEAAFFYAGLYPLHKVKVGECIQKGSFAVYKTSFSKGKEVMGLNLPQDNLDILQALVNMPEHKLSIAMRMEANAVVSYDFSNKDLTALLNGQNYVAMTRVTTEFGKLVKRVFTGKVKRVVYTDHGLVLETTAFTTSARDCAAVDKPLSTSGFVANEDGSGVMAFDYDKGTLAFGDRGQYAFGRLDR